MKIKSLFYLCGMQVSAKELANIIGGVVEGNPEVTVHSPGKIEEATSGQFTFLGNPKYESYIYNTLASIVLVNDDFKPRNTVHPTIIRVENVYFALSKLMDYFKRGLSYTIEVSPLSKVESDVSIGNKTAVGEFCIIKTGSSIGSDCILHGQNFIGDNVKIGNNVILYPGVKIYHNCQIGDNCIIHANSVIGSDGFGFAASGGDYNKISQIGNVIIGTNVEIGANTVIDRATMGSTIIHDGVKLDNLIQVGHNVVIGNNTVIAAQTGIAGSAKIGEKCIVGGQVGIMGHIEVASGVMIQAKSGIGSTIKEPNSKLYGYPAMDYQAYLRSYAYFKKLPEIVAQIRQLEKELDVLKQEL